MTFQHFLFYFVIYCIVPVSPDTVPGISFQIVEDDNLNWDIVSEQMSENGMVKPITLIQGKEAKITVYNLHGKESCDGIQSINIYDKLSERTSMLLTEPLKKCETQKEACCLMTKKLNYEVSRQWLLVIESSKDKGKITKTLPIHIRRLIEDIPEISRSDNKGRRKSWNLIGIQMSNDYSIHQEFDAFGCVLYNGYENVELKCDNKRTSDSNKIEWSYCGEPNEIGKGYKNISHFITPENDKSYIDCIQTTETDKTVIRVFFVRNKAPLKQGNTNLNAETSEPNSDIDLAGCLKYVNNLEYSTCYNPRVKVPEHSDPRLWLYIILAIVAFLVLATFIYYKYSYRKRDQNWKAIPRNKLNGNSNILQSQCANEATHSYSNAESVKFHKDPFSCKLKLTRKDKTNEKVKYHKGEKNEMINNSLYNVYETQAEPNYAKPYDEGSVYAEADYVDIGQGDTDKNFEYSYVYAHRIGIKPVAKEKTRDQDKGYVNEGLTNNSNDYINTVQNENKQPNYSNVNDGLTENSYVNSC